ncbi:hypothetical protein [Amycolatopsis thermophila]|uniref:Secreted protein n=1 Tax=Amycolatopsis thermophila TaxID=206084 RepID=A0ABU0EMT6_9PSEU|nr:hypothetical protein [Amycolatopsis thermophila]MDQ0376590.1 hypothetical protein [Amycolatopsis thermophila]
MRTARRFLAAAILAATAITANATPAAAANPTHMPVPAKGRGCDYQTTLQTTLRALHEDPADWSVVDMADDPTIAGVTRYPENTVRMNAALPCDLIADVARHEHIHRVQWAVFGRSDAKTPLEDAFGGDEEVERVADCGAIQLGAEYTYYLGSDPTLCTSRENHAARLLNDWWTAHQAGA